MIEEDKVMLTHKRAELVEKATQRRRTTARRRSAMTASTSVITDWRVRDEDALPDVPPGGEHERVIAPQKFVVLRRVVVRDVVLVRLQVGSVEVPFELESEDGPQRTYKLKGLDDDVLKKRLVEIGAAAAPQNTIAVAPGLEICTTLRNEGNAPAKPRAALVVYEEN